MIHTKQLRQNSVLSYLDSMNYNFIWISSHMFKRVSVTSHETQKKCICLTLHRRRAFKFLLKSYAGGYLNI